MLLVTQSFKQLPLFSLKSKTYNTLLPTGFFFYHVTGCDSQHKPAMQ